MLDGSVFAQNFMHCLALNNVLFVTHKHVGYSLILLFQYDALLWPCSSYAGSSTV